MNPEQIEEDNQEQYLHLSKLRKVNTRVIQLDYTNQSLGATRITLVKNNKQLFSPSFNLLQTKI